MKAFMNWSGGKDSALCLFKPQQQGIPVSALVTSLSNGRVTMHGVRKELIKRQADVIGLPVYFIETDTPGMESYEDAVHTLNVHLQENGFTHVISGDIFLEDLKQYRENLYGRDGLKCLFPLWGIPSRELVNEFINEKFHAIIIAVNGEVLNPDYCGRLLDQTFIHSLPDGVDVCGENGEYHSFVFDGPLFKKPINYRLGSMISKNYPRPKNESECFLNPAPDMKFFFQEILP